MLRRIHIQLSGLRECLADIVTGPLALGLLPAALLAAFWAGGETALLVAAIAVPGGLAAAVLIARGMRPPAGRTGRGGARLTGRSLQDALDAALVAAARDGGATACIMIEIETYDALLDAGASAAQTVIDRIAQHLRGVVRRRDRVFYIGGGRFGIAIAPAPARSVDAEAVAALARRIEEGIGTAASQHGMNGPALSVRSGTALAAADSRATGAGLVRRAGLALGRPPSGPPSPPRSPACGSDPCGGSADALCDEASGALDRGEIHAWFQPQICLETGAVSGIEALARWRHPRHGVISPAHFLPQLARARRNGRLLEVMLQEALAALREWQGQGCAVPRVGVNFDPEVLRDPALPDIVAWELDRHGFAPERLCVEIMETVVSASPDDQTARNIRRLSELGCPIDLDDFGTGHASISSLRRFAVNRLKIDRSFIRGIDTDPDQQQMVAAILTMAAQLGLGTVAEGVETAAEHARLARLGCGHAQGFAVARPMPQAQTLPWLQARPPRADPGAVMRKSAL